jgi:hypothetical protein
MVKLVVSSVNPHMNALGIRVHLWKIDLRFATGLPPERTTYTIAVPLLRRDGREAAEEKKAESFTIRTKTLCILNGRMNWT